MEMDAYFDPASPNDGVAGQEVGRRMGRALAAQRLQTTRYREKNMCRLFPPWIHRRFVRCTAKSLILSCGVCTSTKSATRRTSFKAGQGGRTAENRWMDDLANFLCRCQTWQETARREEEKAWSIDRSMEMELTYIAQGRRRRLLLRAACRVIVLFFTAVAVVSM